MSDPQHATSDVSRLVEMLGAGEPDDRRRAAIELGRLGVRTRGVTPPPPSIDSPRESQFPAGGYQSFLKAARTALQDPDPEVRREVAFDLGEWGGREAVAILEEAQRDDDPSVRAASVRALGQIGGPQAVSILEQAASHDPGEEVRSAAVSRLASLARQAATEKERPTVGGVTRTRGAVRPRGVAPRKARRAGAPRSDVEKIIGLLRHVRESDRSWDVREQTGDALADLGQ